MQKKPTKKKRTTASKSKQRPKRLNTFHQSDFSLLQDNINVGSISDLFKNQAIKKKPIGCPNSSQINFNSTINNYTSVYTVISSIPPNKSQKQKSQKNIIKNPNLVSKKKGPQKCKSKSKINPDKKQVKKKKNKNQQKIQSYERIPQSKNSLNSEIVFSIQDTKRQSDQYLKRKQQSSRLSDNYASKKMANENLINTNKMLRSTIKQEFKRKNQAAIKIQKVFRGYLTRKILQKYIKEQQQKLNQLLAGYKTSNKKHNQKVYSNRKSNQYDFFSNKNSISQRQHTSKTFQDQQSINLSKIHANESKISSEPFHSHRIATSQRENIINCEDQIASSSQQSQNQDQEIQNQQHQPQQANRSQQNDQDNQQSSDQQMVAYRHHQHIYSQRSQIQKYLQSSSDQQDENKNNKQKFNKLYQHDQVIFQTNQQHIQSRKNSILNKQSRKNSLLSNNKDNVSPKTRTIQLINQQKHSSPIVQQQKLESIEAQFVNQLDLIKTSKVNSIHNTSRNNEMSINLSHNQKIQRSPVSKQQKGLTQTNIQLDQKTQKKQCKKAISIKKSLNVQLSSNSSLQQDKSQRIIYQSQSDGYNNNDFNLETIKISHEEYLSKIANQKKTFIDTVSYNSDFKHKNNLKQNQLDSKSKLTSNIQQERNKKSIEKAGKNQQKNEHKREAFKKRIYYFSDSEDQGSMQNSSVYFQKNLSKDKSQQKFDFQSIQQQYLSKCNNNGFQILKNSEIKKWDQVIKLIHRQSDNINDKSNTNKQIQNFMTQVMQLSLKNKQLLKDMIISQNEELNSSKKKSLSYKNPQAKKASNNIQQRIDEDINDRWKQFKEDLSNGRRKSITEQDIAIFKPNNSRVKAFTKQHIIQDHKEGLSSVKKQKGSFFKQSKQELKSKINKIQEDNLKHAQQNLINTLDYKNQFTLLNNIQNDHIDQMLKIREQMLQKRQCQQLTKLNQRLINKQISQTNFLSQLKKLTQIFQNQKISIDRARDDINKGYNAALKLIREAFVDAKKIGYKLPLSKSSDSYKLNKHLGFGELRNFNSIIIDELNNKNYSFQMKHVKSPQHQETYCQRKNEKQQQKQLNIRQTQKQQPKSNSLSINIKQINLKNSKQEAQKNIIQNEQFKEFIRSQNTNNVEQNTKPKLQQRQIVNNDSSNSYSNSSSIINNLSSNSFKDQYFEPQNSPKHQAIRQTSSLNMKNDIFGSGGQFEDLSQQSSDIQFSQQELKRFRKAQPYDPSIVNMNKNLMIGSQFIQMQRNQQNNSSCQSDGQNCKHNSGQQTENFRLRLYRQVYEIQQNDIQSSQNSLTSNQNVMMQIQNANIPIRNKRHDPKVDLLTQKYVQYLIFQISYQILMKPLFSQKFLSFKRQQMFGIKKVSDQSRKQFIKIVSNILPSGESLLYKLNQNISPLPRQLLKCMRIDFSEDDQMENDDDEEYQQIGKYEMILDQELCNQAIEKYRELIQLQKQQQQQLQLLTSQTIQSLKVQYTELLKITTKNQQQKIFNYLNQRQKFVINRKQHCEGIRWEFINMELHCIFDSWNEQIIQLKANKTGFSGIGLNQLTLSMVDRNRKIKSSLVDQIMEQSKFKVMKILKYQNEIIDQIYQNVCGKQNANQIQFNKDKDNIKDESSDKNQKQISQNRRKSLLIQMKDYSQKYKWIYQPSRQIQDEIDTNQQSKWVYYSDQALSYGLELVYLIEQQIFGQLAKQLRKSMLKINFV